MSKDETLNSAKNLQNEYLRQKQSPKNSSQKKDKLNLIDLLYNKVNDTKIPLASDIVQSTYDDLEYVFGNHVISDCYLLTNLLSLVKKNPKKIMELITPKNENEVSVKFYGAGYESHNINGNIYEVRFKQASTQMSYSVTRKEALNWKTCHRALWPVVIEIAYAKHLQHTFTDKNFISNLSLVLGSNLTLSKIDASINSNYRKLLEDFASSLTIVYLLGGKSIEKIYIKPNEIEKFSERGKYNSEAENTFKLIQEKLSHNKLVTVSFRDGRKLNKRDATSHGATAVSMAKTFKQNPDELKKIYSKNKSKVDEWMHKNNTNLEKLSQDENQLIDFVVDIYNKLLTNSKTQYGICTEHEYAVVGTLDNLDGYNYVVIRNPHDVLTKIDYRKSKKIPEKITLPEEISDRNECRMELNHFMKKIKKISYSN